MMQNVTADTGGIHARFALADVEAPVVRLGEAITHNTAEHASFQTARQSFGKLLGQALSRAAAIAVACPIAFAAEHDR